MIILVLMIVLSSCKKEKDTTAPVITLKGNNPATAVVGVAYADPGATSSDDVDGDISSSITSTSTVSTTQAGTYTVTYTITDEAGNTATATRTVNVMASLDYLNGGYTVVDVVTGKNAGTHNYTVTVSAMTSVNNKLLIYNYGGFGSSVYVEVTLSGGTFNIISQNPLMMSDPGTITGSVITNTSAVTSVTYDCVYTSGGSDTGSATYTKL